MTLLDQLHKSKAHREGFDPNCPLCLRTEGINGIIEHLTKCWKQNDSDARAGERWEPRPLCGEARAVAAEQFRMLGILKLYRMHVQEDL